MAEIKIREAEDIVKHADELGKKFSRQVKTHQLRNFYSGITQIRQEWKRQKDAQSVSSKLVMLQPKLAYAAGRQSSIKEFVSEISREITNTRNDIKALAEEMKAKPQQREDLEKKQREVIDNFFALIEGIVAYHKFYGGD
ncbi:MAG: type III-A CRISPR-associated protein Csm2 [Bacteroidia bacterium]|nr:type III-A CRISPR-associated protein Csm2 [Bacteroidia bacterium]